MLPLPGPLTPSVLRPVAALVTALGATLALGACTAQPQGGEKLEGEAGRVQETIRLFGDRARDGDGRGICADQFTPELATSIGEGLAGCPAAVEKIADATDVTSMTVDSVKVTGTTAVATIDRTKRASDQTKIVLERPTNGAWRIAAFGNDAAKAAQPAETTPAGSTPAGSTPAGSTPKS